MVLFVSGVICNGYNQPVSSAEGEEGADISCHCKALHSAAQQSCTAADMIFVKMFTLANFGPVMFFPKPRNSLESTEA